MREGLDHWPYVLAAYALAIIGTLSLTGWSWLTMRRAEARRDKGRRGGKLTRTNRLVTRQRRRKPKLFQLYSFQNKRKISRICSQLR